ncbi:MAG: hypothetical protein R3D55_26110 [Chloroflexota bacterium]
MYYPPQFALEGNFAVLGFHHAAHDGKAQPPASLLAHRFVFGAEELGEQFLLVFFRDAQAIVPGMLT